MSRITIVRTVCAGLSLALLLPGAFAASVGSLPVTLYPNNVFGLGDISDDGDNDVLF